MKSRTTLILVLVALLIGGLVVLDYYKGTPTEDARAKQKALLDFDYTDITRVELVRSNQTIVLEKSGDNWEIKQPLAVRADFGAVRSILDELQFAQRERTLTEKDLTGAKLAEFGLQSPRLRVSISGKKGSVRLLIGNDTPAKSALYAQVQGQGEVLVTRLAVAERLDRSLTDLRDRAVMDISPVAASRLEIKSTDRILELVKSSPTTNVEPRWAITRPLAVRADQARVSELLSNLNNLRVADFISEDPKDVHTYQLDEPVREVTVWTDQPDSSKTLLIGKPLSTDAAKVYAKRKGADSIFTVAADAVQKLALTVNDMRDHQILAFSDANVNSIELLRGADKVLVSRDSSGAPVWKLTAADLTQPVNAEDSLVRQLLTQLASLTATQFTADVATDLDKFGLAAPTLTVTLLGNATNVLSQLLIGSLDESNTVRYVKRGDDPFVFGVEPGAVNRLPAGFLTLRTRRIVEFPPDAVTSLTIQRAGTQTAADQPTDTVLARASDSTWDVIVPSKGTLDADALQGLLYSFCQLHAREFLPEGGDNPGAYGLEKPVLTITAFVGDKPYTLAVGAARDSQQTYALWSAPPLLMTLATTDVNTLLQDPVVRPAPPSPAAATNAVPSASAPTGVEVVTPPVAAPPAPPSP